tara:strand:- start:1131 stop:2099 length:969 start_codon:yes stop_codon:yes gene_type:complete
MKCDFTDVDMDLGLLADKTVAVIGYGIQGENQAKILRDNGVAVMVHNRADAYADNARRDGFDVHPIDEAVAGSDITMLLIPDGSQAQVYNEGVAPHIRPDSMLVTAHGYSITYGGLEPREDIDVCLLAPRYPGQVIRENYEAGKGTLAFFGVHQDATGKAKETGLALAKGVGLTELLEISLVDETHVDLWIENFLIPRLRGTIEACYAVAVENGIPPAIAALEAYQSNEILGLLTQGVTDGLYETFHGRTSPTCQFGVASGDPVVNAGVMELGREIYANIVSGDFAQRLVAEESAGYPVKNAFNERNLGSEFAATLKRLREE